MKKDDLLDLLIDMIDEFPELELLILAEDESLERVIQREDDGQDYLIISFDSSDDEEGLSGDMIEDILLGVMGVYEFEDELYVADSNKNIILGRLEGKYDEIEELKDVVWKGVIIVFIKNRVVH